MSFTARGPSPTVTLNLAGFSASSGSVSARIPWPSMSLCCVRADQLECAAQHPTLGIQRAAGRQDQVQCHEGNEGRCGGFDPRLVFRIKGHGFLAVEFRGRRCRVGPGGSATGGKARGGTGCRCCPAKEQGPSGGSWRFDAFGWHGDQWSPCSPGSLCPWCSASGA